MTALINVEGALPRPLWSLTRYLLGVPGRRQKAERVQAILSPPSLFDSGADTERTFKRTVTIAKELGVLDEDDGYLALTAAVAGIGPDDVEGFYDVLRHSVLHRVSVDVLGSETSNTEGKDLLRALCFFMTLPSDKTVDINTFSKVQAGAVSDEFRNPFQNTSRWNFFPAWAEALGFAATPLLHGNATKTLTPDCRTAVRRAALAKWRVGTTLSPQELVDGLLDELPVLPGGAYSRALKFDVPEDGASEALSIALLAGHDDGWLELTSRSDAPNAIQLSDPDAPSGTRQISTAQIKAAA
ncbi:MAG: hypothetical protein K0U84_24295 [Actinomycetia bacterium]|nr:hypothetical protein [Actinomycetes bacterium]